METDQQEDFKLEVKVWLKKKGVGYAWLAERCHVSEATVRNWMAQRKIPLRKQAIIKRLMSQSAAACDVEHLPISVKTETVISIRMSAEMQKQLEKLSSDAGLSTEMYLLSKLSLLCRK